MSGTASFVWEWEWEAPLGIALILLELGYVAVWVGSGMRRRCTRRAWALLAAFTGGLGAIVFALMSPIGANDERLLSMHMIEHDLLIWIVAPLLLMGALPLLQSVRPRRAPSRPLAIITHPALAWAISTVVLWAWHAPPLYGLALTNPIVHGVEHLWFVGGYLLYWWPLLAPPAAVGRLHSNVARVGYLLAGATQSALLGAVIMFRGSVIYSQYLHIPGATLSSALADQRLAGALMWFPGAVVFALAAALAIREGDTQSQEADADAAPGSVKCMPPGGPSVRVSNTM
ncbi:MAG TPA: cytochrome c oxidase assembly protein [Gemmatimonadales bacterium]|nr:cytochrome c oxidase assembly protein [Gemmatimonadales bacterium]